jgi:hypothetical protein
MMHMSGYIVMYSMAENELCFTFGILTQKNRE